MGKYFSSVVLASIFLACVSTANGQDASELQDILADYRSKVSSMEREYVNNLTLARKQLIDHLSKYAKKVIASGEVEQASDAWKEVLRLDSDNASAKSFFRTLRILPAITEELANESEASEDSTLPVDDASQQKTNASDQPLAGEGGGKPFDNQLRAASIENLNAAVIAFEGEGPRLSRLRPRSKMYLNRDQYAWKEVPETLQDWVVSTGTVGSPPELKIRVKNDGWVFILVPLRRVYDPRVPENRALLARDDWRPVTLVGAPFESYLCLAKSTTSGQEITVPHFHTFGFTHIVHPATRVSQ
ncbi:hypothetical protein [Crateriforma conspicua]|uniref:Tetratricopeptide repeat protein n=1 Tax=Crateriforma conspicua TaxID=2527996 RepID=A0A5C6G0J7_9PLAN|nr:hypothetical protein [Crateriforma conspicua]TWU67138.1 hypothetical protein V7x_27110 [Crateriforma conspicua]